MAARERKRVVVAVQAIEELAEIWRWNAKRYSREHADAYLQFLDGGIESLATRFALGRRVAGHSDIQYIVFRRRSGSHGHIAAYRVDEDSVNVLRVFHTAQNWQEGFGLGHPPE